jgi:3-dehydroquinate synthase
MYQSIPVELNDSPYSIDVGFGLREQLADILTEYNQGQIFFVISQQAILDHYEAVLTDLAKAGYRLVTHVVPGDESAKNIRHAEALWTAMVAAGCDRSTTVLALGGGVVGDLSGFVASTYMRGIDVVQIPTTLLAMIDSAIGGKTAINLDAGKNLVGRVYQPKKVIVDLGFLATLPERNVVSSMAEAIKYGFIREKRIFDVMDARFDDMVKLDDEELLLDIIASSCRIKAEIVANDQFEHGERRLLNYGHTIGHALETIHAYSGLYHGEAVLYGMKCANNISFQKGLLTESEYLGAQAALDKFPLPELGEVDPDQVLEIVSHDKKNINGKLHFVLIDGIGNGITSTEVTPEEMIASLTTLKTGARLAS